MRKVAASLVVAFALPSFISGCAKPPEAIAAAYVSDVPYMSFTCPQLSEETARLSSAYTTAAAQQSRARSNDVAGVILLGLPVSSLSGDNISEQVASLKGQQEAVRSAGRKKGCRATS